MKLYNTLTRKIDIIEPLNPPEITIYTCGPTVYDYLHIGNWFTYIREDILIRTLKLSGLQTKWVMNITDVGHLVSDADDGEDKLEKGAKRDGKTAWEIAEFYTKDFLDCLDLLNICKPDHIPRATEHIAEQIELIQSLDAKGYTYVIDDGVYYDTSRFEGYAAFARLDLEGQQAGARVEYNPEKRNPTDFALWKFSPADQQRDMEWESPFRDENDGKGFPGWHIECSAMSMKYLGETLDIHAGGIDHVPVHHTNEIAQSEAATGKRFANYWMHGNHVMVEGEKISKSLGNGIRLQEIVEKGISAQTVRMHVLESHYRSQSLFSMDSLEAAQNRLRNLYGLADLQFQPDTDASRLAADYLYDSRAQIQDALEHDLNTPEALRIISKVVDDAGTVRLNPHDIAELSEFLAFLEAALGLDLTNRQDISTEQHDLISRRTEARASKDWTKSDELRDQLAGQHIGLRDTPSGPVWFRT